jgi:uncharacterized protein (UPF0333 family)
MNNESKQKGQISIDLLFSIVIFLVTIGILLGYVNNFESVSKDYSTNMSGYSTYITTYDKVKSLDQMDFNSKIYFNNIDFNFDSSNGAIILDENNNYVIYSSFYGCNVTEKWCGK